MMNFKIVTSKAEYINLTLEKHANDDFELAFNVSFPQENERLFIITFKATVMSSSGGYTLSVEFASFFEAEQPLTDEFKNSQFPSVNASAIAYPYFRALISTLTLNAGYEAIIIPTINFQARIQEQM